MDTEATNGEVISATRVMGMTPQRAIPAVVRGGWAAVM